MNVRGLAVGFPLLTKELMEQAARKRTYVVRGLYALLLCGFTVFLFYTTVYRDAAGPSDVFFRGPQLFEQLLRLQLIGIFLFMPALMCGVISGEKERSTLGMLLLTRLSPWTIVLEKFLSRLVAMGTFLLMSVPPLMFCYTIGGLSVFQILGGMWLLLVTSLQVGSVALACSSFFRTTMQSFIATYLVLGVLMWGIGMSLLAGWEVVPWLFDWSGTLFTGAMNGIVQMLAKLANVAAAALGANPIYETPAPGLFYESLQGYSLRAAARGPDVILFAPLMAFVLCPPAWRTALPAQHTLLQVFVLSIPSLLSAGAMLWAARYFLVRRAFSEPKNRLLKLFRRLDALFQDWNNNSFTRGIVLTKEHTTLPGMEPIVWRETQKKALGTARYLIRILLVLEIPTAFVCAAVLTSGATGRRPNSVEVAALTLVLWTIAALILAVRSAGLIAGERQRETLDVLMSSPLWCGEIVRQKMRGVRRLWIVLAVPLVTCIATQMSWRFEAHRLGFQGNRGTDDGPWFYLMVSLACLLIQLPIIAWIGLWVSLCVRSQSRAILTTVMLIAGWTIIGRILWSANLAQPGWAGLSPIAILLQFWVPPLAIAAAEEGTLMQTGGYLWWTACLMTHWVMLVFLRAYVRQNSARWLGRSEIDH